MATLTVSKAFSVTNSSYTYTAYLVLTYPDSPSATFTVSWDWYCLKAGGTGIYHYATETYLIITIAGSQVLNWSGGLDFTDTDGSPAITEVGSGNSRMYIQHNNHATGSLTVNGGTAVSASWSLTSSKNFSAQSASGSFTTYSVAYNRNGGTSTNPSTQYVRAGSAITVASAATRTSTTATTATYTHTFNSNTGNTPSFSSSKTYRNTTTTYTFNGWHEGSATGTNHNAGSSWTPGANTTLVASWTSGSTNAYTTLGSLPTCTKSADVSTATRTVTLNANGGTVTATQLKTTSTTTKTYSLNGWYTASSGGSKVTTGSSYSSGQTFYAQWGPTTTTSGFGSVTLPTPTYATSTSTKSITITYSGNGGTISPTSTTRTVTTNTTHAFNGWHEGSATGTNHNAGSYTPSGNITLVASWNNSTVTTTTTLGTIPTSGTKSSSTTTATRTITFNANGGSVSPTSRNSTQTTTITYPFNGMYTAASGGNKISTSTATNANTTYYAQWGTSTSTGNWTAVALPTPTWSIHKPTGWYTASSGGTKRGDANGSYTPTTAETLYAQWTSGLHANVSGTWKPATAAYIKVDGTWKTATAIWIKVAGTWTTL